MTDIPTLVTASPDSGTYSSPQSVTLTPLTGYPLSMVYTLDKSIPSLEDTVVPYRLPDDGSLTDYIVARDFTLYMTLSNISGEVLGGVYKGVSVGKRWDLTSVVWTKIEPPVNICEHITEAKDGSLLLIARSTSDNSAGIYKSADKGITWNKVFALDGYSCGKLLLASDSNLYGVRGTSNGVEVLKSIDNGTNWAPIGSVNNSNISDAIVESQSDDLFIFGTSGIYKSTDKGITWNSISQQATNGIVSIDSTILLSCDYSSGVIRKSTDNGTTWNLLATLPSNTVGSIVQVTGSFVAKDDGYMIVEGSGNLYVATVSGLYKSVDGGITWTVLSNMTGISRLQKSSWNSPFIWIAGNYAAGLYCTHTNGITYSNPIQITNTSVLSVAAIFNFNANYATYQFSYTINNLTPEDIAFGGISSSPNDSYTLELASEIDSFAATSTCIRRIFSNGDLPIFKTTLTYQCIESELNTKRLILIENPVLKFEYPNFPLSDSKAIFTVCSKYSTSHTCEGGSISFQAKVSLLWDASLIPGSPTELPVICPFPLPVESFTKSSNVELEDSEGYPSPCAYTRTRSEKANISWHISQQGMKEFMKWWASFCRCGRRKFLGNIHTNMGVLLEFAKAPTFTADNSYYTIAMELNILWTGRILEFQQNPPNQLTSGGSFNLIITSAPLFKGALSTWKFYSVLFTDEGDVVSQDDWNATWDSNTQLITIRSSTNLKGNYKFCIYGGGLISSHYFIYIQ